MTDIDISASDAHAYRVTMPGASRRFIFRVPENFLERVAVTDSYEPLLARKSVEYIVEHGIADGLPDTFTPADIEALLPAYPKEIKARLSS